MTVREMIEQLQKCDPEHVVIMAKDGEGNGFSTLAEMDCDNSVYVPDSTWGGEVKLHHLNDELRAQRYSEEDVADDPNGQRAVVLWPTN